MKIFIKIIKSVLLVVVAVILFVILYVPSTIVTLIRSYVTDKGETLNVYFKGIALSIDQLGNVVCKDLFYYTLITKKSSYGFGNPDETISSVLGKNKRDNTLSFVGKIVTFILDTIDENHSIKSIDENNNYKL